jgi:hypothetical protein
VDPTWWVNHTADAKEAGMFIGQVEETGVIEPWCSRESCRRTNL